MYSKEDIFNLALSALLLQRRVTNADTDQSNEVKVLRSVWEPALASALEDLDLDSLSSQIDLELIEEDPNRYWKYAYKYPTNCAKFRRLQSCAIKDNRDTQIPKRVGIHDGEKAIFTNLWQAVAEYIPKDVPLSAFSATAGIVLAYKLAILSAPLVTGKGAKDLIAKLTDNYKIFKAEAQEQDRDENHRFEDPVMESDMVRARF